MLTLIYGLKLPETADKGSTFFPALEDNINQLDAHDHDGIDSALIPSSSLTLTTQSILAANWVSLGEPGNYRQVVTMPAPLAYDGKGIFFKNSSNGDLLYLTVEKVSANSYYVYINDNTISLTAIYV